MREATPKSFSGFKNRSSGTAKRSEDGLLGALVFAVKKKQMREATPKLGYVVYILKSKHFPDKWYVGFTRNLERRIEEHNKDSNTHYTKRYAPWELINTVTFLSKSKAEEFEKYLKSHSGRVFMKKRFGI